MMSDFVPAVSEGGRIGYGFGLEQYVLGGDIGMIGHLGGTAGYRTGTFWLPAFDLSIAFALSVQTDPTPVIAAALSVMAP
jgi:CubicO group peptidase (beta-lactamase class C family)